MEKHLNADVFYDFKGWETFRKIPYNKNIITGLNLSTLKGFDIKNKFFELCNNCINSNSYDDNKVLLNRIQIDIISKGYDYTTDLLIKFFETHYNNFNKEIQELINEDNFTISIFKNKYNDLNNKLNKIKYLLSSIDYSYKNKDGKKTEYSFINLVKNYTSYNLIINNKFIKNDNEIYLYELFISEIENNFDTETILEIFKLYDFYNKFSYSIKNKTNKSGEEYFNSELNKKIQLSENTSNRFLVRIIEIINKKIIDLSNNETISLEKLEYEINSIRKLIDITPELCNKNIFVTLYKKALTTRLKNGVNPDIENEFLKSINPQDDIDIYIKMKNQINDIKLNTIHNQYFRNLKVGGSSEKYKNLDIDKYDRNKVNVKVFRSYDWDYENIDQINQVNLPIELSIYSDIFNAYYKDRFNERKLYWIYEDSIGIIEIETDKLYNIKMNLLQMALLYSLNEKNKSANELSSELKIPIQQIGIIINSLLISKLIYRDKNSDINDPSAVFFVNENFSNNESNISILTVYNKLKHILDNKPNIETNSFSQLPSETVVKAKIMGKIINEKIISKEKLIDEINNYFKLNIPSSFYDNIIKNILENDKIKLSQNNIIEYNNIDNDDNIDDDIDLEA